MRRVRWDRTILDALHPADPAERWTRVLLDGGYFLDFDADPRWVHARRLREAVRALAAAEDALIAARTPLAITVGEVHPALWLGPIVVVAALARLVGLAYALAAGALGFGAIAWVGLGATARAWLRRRRELETARIARQQAGEAAYAALRDLFGEAFVAEVAFVRVECDPGPAP